MSLFLSESIFTCHCINIEEWVAHCSLVATVNAVLYNEVEMRQVYGAQFM